MTNNTKITDELFTQLIWDDILETFKKANSGEYTQAEALLQIHNDIDNWTPELIKIVDKEAKS